MLNQERFKAASHRLINYMINDVEIREMTIHQMRAMLQAVDRAIGICAEKAPFESLLEKQLEISSDEAEK